MEKQKTSQASTKASQQKENTRAEKSKKEEKKVSDYWNHFEVRTKMGVNAGFARNARKIRNGYLLIKFELSLLKGT